MGFINFFGRNFISWGGSGTNNFTKTPNPWGAMDVDNSNAKEQWVTILGHEANIYRTTPEVYIVFNRFASMFSNGIFQEIDKNGEVVENSEIVKRLLKPNALLNGKSFMQESALHYLVFGNRITYKLLGSSLQEAPSALWNLPPDRIKIKTTGLIYEQTDIDSIISEYYLEYDQNGTTQKKTWNSKEIIHHKAIDLLNPIKGKSALEALQMPISNIRGAYGYRNVNIVKRGALGVLSNENGKDSIGQVAPISSEQRLKIEKQYTSETHGIFDEQSPISILNGKWSFTSTSGAIKDMMLFEEISEDMKKIIDSVNLNDNIFSKEKSKVQANLNEGIKMAYQDGIIPFANDFCNNLTEGLNLKNGHSLVLNYSHIEALQEDEKSKMEVELLKAKTIETYVKAGYSKEEALNLIEETV
jgi:hypothetical protein